MELSEKSLEIIGRYVRQNLPEWLQQLELPGRREWELQLTERIVRVEEELKAQRELMQQGFAENEKRFEESTRQIAVWLGLITVLIALIGSMGAWGMFAG
jgi:hypothetical protein